jgi:hypothetical protein
MSLFGRLEADEMGLFGRLFSRRVLRASKTGERVEPTGPVGTEEIAKAREYLRTKAEVDIDQFLTHRANVSIFEQPLGNTKHCLSVSDVAGFVERNELDLNRRAHLAKCEECRVAVATYRRAAADDWDPFTQSVAIYKAHEIRLPKGADFFLILTNKAENRVLQQLDPHSISVTGAIEAADCTRIDSLDAKQFNATEAVALRFKDYSVNLPEKKLTTPPIADWLTVSGQADGMKVHKQALVCLQVD